MNDIRIVNFKSVLWRIAEALMLSAGAAGLVYLAYEKRQLIGIPNLPPALRSPYWLPGILLSAGVLVFLGAFAAIIESVQWLSAIIVRGPFLIIRVRDKDRKDILRIISIHEAERLFWQRWLKDIDNHSS